MVTTKRRETVETLREATERNRTRIERRSAVKRSEEEQKLAREARSIAGVYIKRLPKEIKKAVRRGEYSIRLLDSLTVDGRLFGKVAGIISEHCWKKGLTPKTEHYTPIGSDDLPSHDILYVSWGKN